MTEEDKVELHLEISRKVLAEFKQELESECKTITQDILNEEVETAITGYTKAKKLKLIGTG
jgi:O-methyltransferase involved in polyketide biosynthesis